MLLTNKQCTHTKVNCLKYNYLHKIDLALNNLQMLICHKTQPPKQPNPKPCYEKKHLLYEMFLSHDVMAQFKLVNHKFHIDVAFKTKRHKRTI